MKIFKIKKEERWLMLFVFILLAFLHGLLLYHYTGIFTPLKRFYWPLFIHNFHVSGFDPITYSIVSDWTAGYNVYRHPLLAFFMYPPYLLNQGLMALTGKNCAIYVVAAMQVFWGFYAVLFFYRIVREIVEVSRRAATILTLFFLSFGYVMLTCIVPDHFVISMMLLLLALYASGKCIVKGRELKTWQSILYFVLTAGVSLNNGLKVFLAGLFVNKWRFFRPVNILLGVLLPALLMWGFCRWEYATFVWPQETARHKAKQKKKEQQKKRTYEMKVAQAREDSLLMAQGDTATLNARLAARRNDAQKAAEAKKKRQVRQGKPISNGEFMRWTDITSSRWEACVENLFGESIQIHQDYLLGDVLRSRPMVVHYRWWLSYFIETIIVLLFLCGIWIGRSNRFLWLALSFLGMDMALHIGLGFGINEVYIMAGHWIFSIPIAIACLLRSNGGITPRYRQWVEILLAVITLYLFIYNIALIIQFFVC